MLKTLHAIQSAPEPHWVGDGFPVRTIITPRTYEDLTGPFILLDYAGPVTFPPGDQPRGVDQHPHKGFETVTIVYQGEIEHRDSAGNAGKIGPGDVQWMSAASGVVHEEKHGIEFTRAGGTLHMVQLWVNLPAADKAETPHYQELFSGSIPVVPLAESGGTARIIAGRYHDVTGAATTHTPINLWDLRLEGGSACVLPVPDGHSSLLLVLSGELRVGGEQAEESELAIISREGEGIAVEAIQDSTALLLSGEPIHEPMVAHGPFVMNTQEEIRQAFLEYQSGKMGSLL